MTRKELLTSSDTWIRGLYMLLFVVVLWVARAVAMVVALVQFVLLLVTGAPNARLAEFGRQLSVYLYHVYLFLTFATPDKPFPFSDWPRYVPLQTGAETPTKPEPPHA